jgi:tRNA-binding protein
MKPLGLWRLPGARYDARRLASLDDFLALDLRVGTIVSASVLRGSRKPAYALAVDFGALGRKDVCVQIAGLYDTDDLVGLQLVAVLNLPAKPVAGFVSEALVLTVDDAKGENVLLIPERPVPDGGRVR